MSNSNATPLDTSGGANVVDVDDRTKDGRPITRSDDDRNSNDVPVEEWSIDMVCEWLAHMDERVLLSELHMSSDDAKIIAQKIADLKADSDKVGDNNQVTSRTALITTDEDTIISPTVTMYQRHIRRSDVKDFVKVVFSASWILMIIAATLYSVANVRRVVRGFNTKNDGMCVDVDDDETNRRLYLLGALMAFVAAFAFPLHYVYAWRLVNIEAEMPLPTLLKAFSMIRTRFPLELSCCAVYVVLQLGGLVFDKGWRSEFSRRGSLFFFTVAYFVYSLWSRPLMDFSYQVANSPAWIASWSYFYCTCYISARVTTSRCEFVSMLTWLEYQVHAFVVLLFTISNLKLMVYKLQHVGDRIHRLYYFADHKPLYLSGDTATPGVRRQSTVGTPLPNAAKRSFTQSVEMT